MRRNAGDTKEMATMGIVAPPEPRLSEAETVLRDEPRAAYHGRLTAAIVRSLEPVDGPHAVFDDIVRQLLKELGEDVSLRASEDILARPVWMSVAHFELMQRAFELERAPLRKIIAVLKRAIEQRQKAEDYWPEGRLNAGIACAAAGDYHQARHLIQEAVDILEGRGPLEGDRAM
jgi:hypothetical protein